VRTLSTVRRITTRKKRDQATSWRRHEEKFHEFNDPKYHHLKQNLEKKKTDLTTKIPKPSLRSRVLRGVLRTALGFAIFFMLSLIRLKHVRGEMFGCILSEKITPPSLLARSADCRDLMRVRELRRGSLIALCAMNVTGPPLSCAFCFYLVLLYCFFYFSGVGSALSCCLCFRCLFCYPCFYSPL
jgi:hypothetical protein